MLPVETNIGVHTDGTSVPLWPEQAHLISFEVRMSVLVEAAPKLTVGVLPASSECGQDARAPGRLHVLRPRADMRARNRRLRRQLRR